MNVESPWTVYRTRFVVRARQLTKPLSFTDVLGREHSGIPGDYLVETSPGFRRITPQSLFEDIYVPLNGSFEIPQSRRLPGAVSSRPMPVNRSLRNLSPLDRRPALPARLNKVFLAARGS
jgi:hypothetical protein